MEPMSRAEAIPTDEVLVVVEGAAPRASAEEPQRPPQTAGPPAAAPHPPASLLKAGLALSAVMKYGQLSLAATADRIESYDTQPYPLTYVILSNHVANFLRALDATQAAHEAGLPVEEASVPSRRPSYGPPLREV